MNAPKMPASRMDLTAYESRLARPTIAKIPEFEHNGRLKHVLFAQQFSREDLDRLADTATQIRAISRTKTGCEFLKDLLSHKRAMLYFTQASTRTFLSFEAACQILGLTTSDIRDPSVSSEYKGESPLDSIRMFSSYFDVIVMRSSAANFAECSAYLMNDLAQFNQRNVPIINAGSGADEHPTQALLDIYTLQRSFALESTKDSSQWTRFNDLRRKYPGLTKGLDDKVCGFCGDIGRGRTVRSLSILLTLYNNVTLYFIAPDHPKLKLSPEMHARLSDAGVTVREASSIADVIDKLDVLYMTRIQHEHDTEEDARFFAKPENTASFKLRAEDVARMKEYAVIMHPFPRNDEIPTEIDTDPRAMYFRQARNGMWIRAAVLASVFNVDSKIATYHAKNFSTFHDYNVGAL